MSYDPLPDGELAAVVTYLEMRRRLVSYFDRRNRSAADELADAGVANTLKVLPALMERMRRNPDFLAARDRAAQEPKASLVLSARRWQMIDERAARRKRQPRALATAVDERALTHDPVVAPVQRGFGSRLIERSARDQLGGEATIDFLPRGVVYTVTCMLE